MEQKSGFRELVELSPGVENRLSPKDFEILVVDKNPEL